MLKGNGEGPGCTLGNVSKHSRPFLLLNSCLFIESLLRRPPGEVDERGIVHSPGAGCKAAPHSAVNTELRIVTGSYTGYAWATLTRNTILY